MPLEGAKREHPAFEALYALALIAVYVGAEFCWDLLGSQPSWRRMIMASFTATLAWFAVRAMLPEWPAARRMVLCVAVCTMLNTVAEVRASENMSYFGTVHTGSDDSFYLKSGTRFAELLAESDSAESYGQVYESLPDTPHLGFIVLLGHLLSPGPPDDLSQLRIVVLLNLLVLQCLAGLVIRLGGYRPTEIGTALLLLVIPGFDLFFFGAAVAKDPVITLLLVALIGQLLLVAATRATFQRIAWLLVLAAALYFMRNFYVLIPPLALVVTRLRSQKGGILRKILIQGTTAAAVAAVVILVSGSLWFQQASVADIWNRKFNETGWGAQIYNVPVAGPIMYSLISPLPPRLTDLANGAPWTDLVRSVGTLGILVLIVTQAVAAARSRSMADKNWRTFLHAGVLVFLISAYGSLEARHRLASTPCLMICYGMVRRRRRAVQTFYSTRPALPRCADLAAVIDL